MFLETPQKVKSLRCFKCEKSTLFDAYIVDAIVQHSDGPYTCEGCLMLERVADDEIIQAIRGVCPTITRGYLQRAVEELRRAAQEDMPF